MTNTKTNSCLPAAPRRGKSSILHSASCTLHSAWCIVRCAFLTVALTAMTSVTFGAPTITKIYSVLGSHEYVVGDDIDFIVVLKDGDDDMDSDTSIGITGGTPSLVLGSFEPGGSVEAAYFDTWLDPVDEIYCLRFRHTVKPGDFSAGLNITEFKPNGATITGNGVTMTSYTLPAGNVLNNETIKIGPTITFADNGTRALSINGNTGDTLEVEISKGGTTTSALNFTMTASASGKVTLPSTTPQFTIPANSTSAICSIPLVGETDDPVVVTFHPEGYNGTAGDLKLTITIHEAEKPHIEAVLGDYSEDVVFSETFTEASREIMILVKMNGNVTDVTGGTPYLNLNVQKGTGDTTARRATYIGHSDEFLEFNYTVLPSDFVPDLDVLRQGFILNGAKIYVNGVELSSRNARNIPYGDAAGSLHTKADIAIRTIYIASTGAVTQQIDGREGETVTIPITRGGSSSVAQGFTITASQPGKVSWTQNFTIPRDADSADLVVSLDEQTTGALTLTIHPNGYSGTDGDIVLTINIAEGTKPPIVITGPSQLEEGSGIQQLWVSLPRAPRDTTTVQIQSSETAYLQILGSASLTWTPGDENPKSVTVQPLDGDKQVTITAHTENTSYSDGTLSVFVANKNPILISPPAEGWEPAKGGEGFGYTVGWSGQDVDADKPTLYAIIHWGDGATSGPITGASGSATHVYNVPGSFGITVELHDKDGGVATASGTVEIEPAVTIIINEYKTYPFPGDVGQNSYKGLEGLGRGTVDDNLTETTRILLTENIDWQIKYSPSTATATLIASPETFTYEGVDYEGNVGDYEYNSFFHVWLGDEETFRSQWCMIPLSAPVTAAIRLRDGGDSADRQVGAVFSREHYTEDNYADIDWDRLPDRWESLYLSALTQNGDDGGDGATYPFETPAGDFGEQGNPDNDFLPACVTGIDAVTGEFTVEGCDFSPTGLAFINLYEVRGTHLGLNAKSSDKIEEVIDEPHKGSYDDDGIFTDNDTREFYGTDPTKADTDEDKLSDGYEYFFWRMAKFGDPENPIGQAYSPTKVVEGDPIDNALIEANFNPCVPNDHLTLDVDGDGLTDFEEFLLGTNPVHWDTDGDFMNDGWEIMWGLNPKDKKDATANPDGDFMANDGIRFHGEVYSHYGFDPRTAWNATYLERNRTLAEASPNTAPFSNYHEHYLARWCIDMGFINEVEPMSGTFMTQPVPYGTPRFYNPAWNGTKRKVPNYSVTPSEGGVADVGDDTATETTTGGYTVPFGDLSYIVEQIPITTHGCDSDGDGMPDGWELYLCTTDGNVLDGLWPIGEGAAKDRIMDAEYPFDRDNLRNIDECRSVELCDYYSSICTNGSFTFSGNWFNKWWPTDPFNPDTDGDHLDDGYEGDATFRYQEAFTPGGTNGAATAEAFVSALFGGTTMLRGHVPGGGLNPCCIDTDMDYIPDHWEYLYAGNNRDTAWAGGFCNKPGTETGLALQNGQAFIVLNGAGMDGTYFDSRSGYDEHTGAEDRNFDFDGDGLENYQEYWINGVRHFQYDKWVAGGDYGDYDIQEIFATGRFPKAKDQGYRFKKWLDGKTPETEPIHPLFMSWDWSTYANDWQNAGGENPGSDPHVMTAPSMFHYMPSEIRPKPIGPYLYASTDPRLADSDGDGMDDYYEMFHGLNPILSDVLDYCMQEHPAGETYDFRAFPWMAGMPNADPDGDDIPNWEEALSPDQPAPANHNTDPSPMWMTDMSYDRSFVNLYYDWGTAANFWTTENEEYPEYEHYPFPDNMVPTLVDPRPHYVFDFECNEGFDTDNDNLSDPYEINGSAGGVTDSQNPDRPIGRKALYLDGNAAARTRSLCAFGPNALRSFTLEVWVMSEEPASGKMQVILERPVTWDESNTAPTYENIRRNFRLGLLGDGRPFVEFDNGGKSVITERALADAGNILEAGKWCHLAATMDGFAGKLSLYKNGRRIAVKSTTQIPYTGFTTTALNAVGSDEYHQPRWSPVVIGASDANPVGRVDGSYEYYNGSKGDIQGGQPQLGDFFKGWVDEVRIWDGARPSAEDAGDQRVTFWGWPTITDDYNNLKRYGIDDVRAARNDVVKYLNRIVDWRKRSIDTANAGATAGLDGSNPVNPTATNTVASTDTTWFLDGRGLTYEEFIQEAVTYIMMTGGEDIKCRIPPSLVCVYNFDTLPDPDYEPVQPAKFAQLNGRPMDYNGVPWLRGATDRSTVYTSTEAPYLFPQYIQNLVSWQPLGHLVAAGTDAEYNDILHKNGAVPANVDANMPLFKYQPDSVVNSKYWTRYTKGGQNLADLEAYSTWGTDTVNSFPNNANPYGYRYETGIIVDEENHPLTMFQEAYDPSYAVLFNDLVPLRNARADMSVQLWDDPTGNKLGVNLDYDGDGLPDWWELANGMDPYNNDQNGNGIRDDMDDFDGDGLLNFYEYRAGVLNPFLADTDADGISDFNDLYDDKLSYGWLYTDADYVLDAYELEWDEIYASPFRYDEHEDRDLDGWDNWSEGIMRTRLDYNTYDGDIGLITWWRTDTNNNQIAQTMFVTTEATPSDKISHFPVPNLKVTVNYYGDRISSLQQTGPTNSGARLIIHAYSRFDMNGWPDVVLAKHFTTDTFPCVIEFTPEDIIYGHIRQGKNWFFAWAEIDGTYMNVTYPIGNESDHQVDTHEVLASGDWPTWSPNEPAAVANNQLDGIDIGFDLNEITFNLTDKPESFVRSTWDERFSVEYVDEDVDGYEVLIEGDEYFRYKIEWPRTWIHEWDIVNYNVNVLNKGKRNFGFGAHGPAAEMPADDDSPKEFTVKVRPEALRRMYPGDTTGFKWAGSFTNWTHSAAALGNPILYGPIGHEIVADARPEFKFSLAPEYTEYQFTLKKNGQEIYNERILAPGRFRNDNDGPYAPQMGRPNLVIWKFPYCIGDRIPHNGGYEEFEFGKDYTWTVVAYAPARKSGDYVHSAAVSGEFLTTTFDPTDPNYLYAPSGKGVIDVAVSYPTAMVTLPSENAFIRVQAFRSKSFNGLPDASVSLTNATTCRLTGLELGVDYYIRAYIEQGDDPLARDKWESWGYYRDRDNALKLFDPVAVQSLRIENVRTPYAVTIQDCDTDNDLLPDAYEWAMVKANNGDLNNFLNAFGVANYAPTVRKTIAYAASPVEMMVAANVAADQDNDGMNDYDEFFSGTNPALADSDGDGIADGLERTLGFDATTPQTLKITSVAFDANGNPVLDWAWDGTSSSTKGRAMLKMGRTVAYVVQGKVALTDPEWKTVRTVYTDEIDGEAVVTEEGAPPDVDVKALRFFRVKVGAE